MHVFVVVFTDIKILTQTIEETLAKACCKSIFLLNFCHLTGKTKCIFQHWFNYTDNQVLNSKAISKSQTMQRKEVHHLTLPW